MNILGIILGFLAFCWQFFLPKNYNLISIANYSFCVIFYLLAILFFLSLINKLLKSKCYDYDITFLVMTLWIANFISYIYFNIFQSVILSFFSCFICFIDIIFLIKRIKKINKSYPKYLFLLLGFYFYLLICFIKFL